MSENSLPSTPSTPKTPCTPTSMTQKLSFVYGSPLKILNFPKITDCDLIRFWIQLYDDCRGTNKDMKKADKVSVINDIAKYLISLWQSHGLETLGEKNVKTKVSRVINRIQEKIRVSEYVHNRSDPQWILDERNHVLSQVFDITNYFIQDDSPSASGSSGTKRKAAELVSSNIVLRVVLCKLNDLSVRNRPIFSLKAGHEITDTYIGKNHLIMSSSNLPTL
jgi:hypothetical protein